MKLQLIIVLACVLAISNAGYIGSNQVYSSGGPNAYIQSSSLALSTANIHGNSITQGGSFIHGGSIAPSVSYVTSNSLVPTSSHGTGGYVSSSHISNAHDEYIPEIKDGVPVDTPEVQRAKAEHFALYAKAEAAAAAASAGQYRDSYQGQEYYQPKQTQVYYPQSNAQYNTVYSYPANQQSLSSSGIGHDYAQIGPVDTPEVQQAKAAHLAAFAKIASDPSRNKHYRYRRGLDYSQLSHSLYNAQPQHVPVITEEGVPAETAEVQAAKAQHFLAHAAAKSGEQGFGSYDNALTGYGTPQVNKVQYSISHGNNYGGWQSYHGPQHIPQLDKNGVPIETPEVQAAKQQHFLAHSQAKQGNYAFNQQNLGWYGQQYSGSLVGSSLYHQGVQITPNGVPEETPEVKAAKAHHFAAHAQEQAKQASLSGPIYGNGYSDEESHANSYLSY